MSTEWAYPRVSSARRSSRDRDGCLVGTGSGLRGDTLAEAGDDVPLSAQGVHAVGRRAIAARTNVARSDGCSAFAAQGMAKLRNVDTLVNREAAEEYRKVLNINLSGCYWMTPCGRVIKPRRSIVNISSVLGLVRLSFHRLGISRARIRLGIACARSLRSPLGGQFFGMDRAQAIRRRAPRLNCLASLDILAQQWRGCKGLRVNALAPGLFVSETMDDSAPGYSERQIARVLDGGLGAPSELAAALVFRGPSLTS